MFNGICFVVMIFVCVCFVNYKLLDESEFRGIIESISFIVFAFVFDVFLELFKVF